MGLNVVTCVHEYKENPQNLQKTSSIFSSKTFPFTAEKVTNETCCLFFFFVTHETQALKYSIR